MSVDVSKLGPAIAAVKDDVAKVGTDVQSVIDKLNGINGVDPAAQAAIDQAVADLGGVVTALDGIDTKVTAASA